MAEDFVQVPADVSGGQKVRSRERTIGANVVQEQYVLIGQERVRTGQHMASGFRTLGTAASPQNIFTIENPAGSAVLVAVKRLAISIDSTAVLITVAPSIKVSRSTALPTGGTAITPMKHDTSPGTAATAILRSGTASDGGVATAITATAGSTGWTRLSMRLHTAVGQVLGDEMDLLPSPGEDPIILRASEALLVQGVVASAATTHFVVSCLFEEFTLP